MTSVSYLQPQHHSPPSAVFHDRREVRVPVSSGQHWGAPPIPGRAPFLAPQLPASAHPAPGSVHPSLVPCLLSSPPHPTLQALPRHPDSTNSREAQGCQIRPNTLQPLPAWQVSPPPGVSLPFLLSPAVQSDPCTKTGTPSRVGPRLLFTGRSSVQPVRLWEQLASGLLLT